MSDTERLLDNAATASQCRELLRDDNDNETPLREAVRLNVVEPLCSQLTTLQRSLDEAVRERDNNHAAWQQARTSVVAAHDALDAADIDRTLRIGPRIEALTSQRDQAVGQLAKCEEDRDRFARYWRDDVATVETQRDQAREECERALSNATEWKRQASSALVRAATAEQAAADWKQRAEQAESELEVYKAHSFTQDEVETAAFLRGRNSARCYLTPEIERSVVESIAAHLGAWAKQSNPAMTNAYREALTDAAADIRALAFKGEK